MKRGIVALMVAVCLGLAAVTVFLQMTEDKKPPEIHFQDNEITYVQGDDYSGLLLGVTATDNRDGDVTDSLVVESVYPNDDGITATIVYVAKDKSNNVGKASKIVKFQYEGSAGETGDEDVVEAFAANQQSGTTDKPQNTPEPTVTATVTPIPEEDADKENEDLPAGSPRITLKEEKVTISRGESVNRISFVESITDDKDSKESLWRGIQITGDTFDRNAPGTYEQIYYVVDSDGNKSNEAKLTIVVE